MAAKMGSTYEGLADSDIVYINGREYWIAPKSIRFLEISGDAVQTSTELYDHVEGILAMDTYTGELVDLSSKFGIDENYPIYFGEHESERFLTQQYGYYDEDMEGAYDSDVLLGTEWSKGIENNKYVYEGDPDGTLTGIEAFWKTMDLGLYSYAFQEGKHPYLINRNVKTRVENILLPQLRIDNDPYIVFDIVNRKMYYAVSIYTRITIGSYSKSPILRFLGVCLIDVKDGVMKFYQNPTLKKKSDPTYPLWKIYLSKYSWKATPTWLRNQLRYPEELFELQLEANYIYHVQDSTTWKREDDFHERPENGDLFYIETDLGDGIEYVGIDLVEYKGQEAKTLAGMYVIRHGEHFGEAIFYHTRAASENLIGPKTARDTYESDATQEISLIADHRHGNTLLYPFGDSIYYYVPTYSTAGDLQQLKLAGFVEAFTREVGYGDDAKEAFEALGIVATDSPGSFTLSSNAETPVESNGLFNLTWTASEYADSYSIYSHDSAISEINNSLTLEAKEISALTHQISEFTNGTYYYIVEATNAYGTITSDWINVTVEFPHPGAFTLSSNAETPVESDGLFNLTWTASEYADNYSIYSYDSAISEINTSLTLEAKEISALTHQISEFTNGTYYYIVEAINAYGTITSNWINVTVGIPHTISYQFEMEETMIYPDDLARFRIEIENYNTNLTANGHVVKVNLSLYIDKALNVNFTILGPPTYSPVANSTFVYGSFAGVNFTLINDTFFSGEGQILSGFVNCTAGDINIHFKWSLIIDGEVVYVSDEKIITVLKE